jgi:hypothetical protein
MRCDIPSRPLASTGTRRVRTETIIPEKGSLDVKVEQQRYNRYCRKSPWGQREQLYGSTILSRSPQPVLAWSHGEQGALARLEPLVRPKLQQLSASLGQELTGHMLQRTAVDVRT